MPARGLEARRFPRYSPKMPGETERIRYRAFLSYSHADAPARQQPIAPARANLQRRRRYYDNIP